MSELIGGKEAKLAWANGESVQIECTGGFFELSEHREFLNVFDNPKNRFRLKPRTITLNGIEVPAPFEPKEGDKYWYIDDNQTDGFNSSIWQKHNIEDSVFIGKWRSKEEIKQVVAALRSVFGKK